MGALWGRARRGPGAVRGRGGRLRGRWSFSPAGAGSCVPCSWARDCAVPGGHAPPLGRLHARARVERSRMACAGVYVQAGADRQSMLRPPPPPPAVEAALSSATPDAVEEADTPTAPELRLPATGIAVIFSFPSTGEGVRAGAGSGVCICTETFNASASPCRSKAVPKRKGGWVGTSTTGAPGGPIADPASRAAPAEGRDSYGDLDQPKKSAICAAHVSLS